MQPLILYSDSWAFCGYTESIILKEVSIAVYNFQRKVVILLWLCKLEAHAERPMVAFQFFCCIFLTKQFPFHCSVGKHNFILSGFVSRILVTLSFLFLRNLRSELKIRLVESTWCFWVVQF